MISQWATAPFFAGPKVRVPGDDGPAGRKAISSHSERTEVPFQRSD